MKFTRTAHSTDEFGDVNLLLVVEIDAALAKRIRELAAEVKRLEVDSITLSDNHAYWYTSNWNPADSDDGKYPFPDEEFTSLDCETLIVRGNDFWWEAHLKGCSVRVNSESILVSELPE